MLGDPRYAEGAGRFADRYAAFDPARQRATMLARAEQLLTSDTTSQSRPARFDAMQLAAV